MSFKKKSYMTQKIIHNFHILKAKEYKDLFVNNEEKFLFELVCKGNTSPKFLNSVWFLFKIHFVWFNWEILGSGQDEVITHNRNASFKGL